MISLRSEFRLLKRRSKETLVLIPGWAFDYRIFSTLDLSYNYLLPTKFYPFSFAEDLLAILNKESIEKISLLGWSLGGFLAGDFARKNPERVDELILLSIRKNYEPRALKEIETKLKKNKPAFLYKFYQECFSLQDKESFVWFRKNLLKDYIREMNLKDLISGLDYLSGASLQMESLNRLKRIRIFQGKEDRIAPLPEALKLKVNLPQVEFVCIPQAGHLPFLNPQFKQRFNHG